MKKILITAILTAALTALVFAGGGQEQSSGAASPAKKDSLTIAVASDPATFDLLYAATMLEAQIGNQIYDNLLLFGEDGSIKPYLAESYSVSPDGLVYTFVLKKGVKFHNGDELTSEDVAFTAEYGKSTPIGGITCGLIGKTETPDKYTVKFTLKEPMASFLSEFAGDQMPIYQKKAVEEAKKNGGEYGSNPIGTGSYKYMGRQTGVDVKLEAFAEHFQGPAPIKNLVYKIIPDNFSAGVALEAGEVDVIWVTAAATAETLKDNPNVVVKQDPSNRVNYISINTAKAPFNNVKLRQALNYAINRDSIVDIVYEGNAESIDNMAFPWMGGYAETSVHYTYDPVKAAALAKEAGLSKDKPITVPIIYSNSSKGIPEILQQNFAEIGINLELQLLEMNAWSSQSRSGDFSLSAGGYYMVYKDMNMLKEFYESNSGINTAKYKSAKADQLLAQGRNEPDPKKRSVIYKQLMDLIQTDAPYVVYCNPANIRAYNKDLVIGAVYTNGIFIRDVTWK